MIIQERMAFGNRIPAICLLFLIEVVTFSCKGQDEIRNEGVAVLKVSFFDSKYGRFINSQTSFADTKLWYKDSLSIQQRLMIMVDETLGVPEKRWIEVIGYTFIDLRTKSYYHYKNLSDTATLVGKWTQPDSVSINNYGGVWNFYNLNYISPVDKPILLTDTTINGILYRRLLIEDANLSSSLMTAYFRCDRRGTLVTYDKGMSDLVGCPLVRYEGVPISKNPNPLAAEIIYERDYLTTEELNIFAAWEKNAKENPVH